MFTRPTDLTDSDVAAALTDGWSLDVDEIEHAPVGFGSHHWIASSQDARWFVTVDDLDAERRHDFERVAEVAARHTSALQLARTLRDLGLSFVIAPTPTVDDAVTHSLKNSYVAAVYPYVEGEVFTWGRFERRDELVAVLDHIAPIHQASPRVAGVGTIDDLVIPRREPLIEALADKDRAWGPGPFAEEAKVQPRTRSSESWAGSQRLLTDPRRNAHIEIHPGSELPGSLMARFG